MTDDNPLRKGSVDSGESRFLGDTALTQQQTVFMFSKVFQKPQPFYLFHLTIPAKRGCPS